MVIWGKRNFKHVVSATPHGHIIGYSSVYHTVAGDSLITWYVLTQRTSCWCYLLSCCCNLRIQQLTPPECRGFPPPRDNREVAIWGFIAPTENQAYGRPANWQPFPVCHDNGTERARKTAPKGRRRPALYCEKNNRQRIGTWIPTSPSVDCSTAAPYRKAVVSFPADGNGNWDGRLILRHSDVSGRQKNYCELCFASRRC